jgi:hypothetical protein
VSTNPAWGDIERLLLRARWRHDRAMRARVGSNEREKLLAESRQLMVEAIGVGQAHEISTTEIMAHAVKTGIAEPEVVGRPA